MRFLIRPCIGWNLGDCFLGWHKLVIAKLVTATTVGQMKKRAPNPFIQLLT